MLPLRALLDELPKSELHVHLKGAAPVELFADLLNSGSLETALRDCPSERRARFERLDNLRPFLTRSKAWTREEVSRLFVYRDFEQFILTWVSTGYLFRRIADFERLVDAVLRRFRSQNIVYAEVTVSLHEYMQHGLRLPDLLAVLEAAATGRTDIQVRWIVDLIRDVDPEAALATLKEVIARRADSVVGITLGGSEHVHPCEAFVEHYRLARDNGLRLTVHAGEASGPDSVWSAIRNLGAERIGHGVRAIGDPALVDYLAEHQIPLEVCPTSNIKTGVYPTYAAHPLKAPHAAGVPITLNTDDPTFFGVTLADEYARAPEMGLPEAETLQLARNGFRHSFLLDPEKQAHIQRLEKRLAELCIAP